MGAKPSTPSAAQQDELQRRKPELIKRAALAIEQADVLFVATGAGWSADSGLAIYRDVADVAAYHERNLTYRDICQPHWVDQDPALFYGFWGGCFNDYRAARPHEGYRIIQRWVDKSFRHTEAANTMRRQLDMANRLRGSPPQDQPPNRDAPTAAELPYAGAFFSFTSNVDAHWITSGVCSEYECHEIHGNCEAWQCADGDGCGRPRSSRSSDEDGESPGLSEDAQSVAVPAHEIASSSSSHCPVAETAAAAAASSSSSPSSPEQAFCGRWRAPPGYRFRVDEASRLAAEGPPLEPASAPCSTGHRLDGGAFASNWPKCVRCGGLARPGVLMFGDSRYVDDCASGERFEEWREALAMLAPKHGWRVAILEIGCGGNVTTVRMQTEEMVEELEKAGVDVCLVRVNPELPFADRVQNEARVLPILSRGLEALLSIDALVGKRAGAPSEFVSALDGFELGGLTIARGNGEEDEDEEGGELDGEGARHSPRFYASFVDDDEGFNDEGEVDEFDSERRGNRVTGGRKGRGNGGVLGAVRAAVETDDADAKDRIEALKRMLQDVGETINRSSAARAAADLTADDAASDGGARASDGGAGASEGTGSGTVKAWERFASSFASKASRKRAAEGAVATVAGDAPVSAAEDVDMAEAASTDEVPVHTMTTAEDVD